jgi:hypothetical protein
LEQIHFAISLLFNKKHINTIQTILPTRESKFN